MNEYPDLDERKKKAVEEFVKMIAKSQAITFVGIVKDGDAPAQYRTGGYKGEGPTFIDVSRSLGVVCAEIANALIAAKKAQGEAVEWDDVIEAIFDSVADGTETARVAGGVQSGTRTMKKKDDERTQGTGGAPRGF